MPRRQGLGSVRFAIARPGDATGAAVTATALRVRSAFRTTEIPLGEIAAGPIQERVVGHPPRPSRFREGSRIRVLAG